MKDIFDTILSDLNEDAKAKAKKAIEKTIRQNVKRELRKRRRKFVKKVVAVTAVTVGAYLAYENREQIIDFVTDKADEVQKKVPVVKIKIRK